MPKTIAKKLVKKTAKKIMTPKRAALKLARSGKKIAKRPVGRPRKTT